MGSADYFSSGGRPLFELAIVLTVAACGFVITRLALRAMRSHSYHSNNTLGWDDLCIVCALVCNIVFGVLTVLATYYGYGNPSKTLSRSDLHDALKMFWGTQILYKAVMMFAKLSMLCMYLRVFVTKKWFMSCCYVLGVLVILYAIASIVATIVQCVPVSRVWNKEIPGRCINLTAFWYSNAIFSILTDFTIILLPIHPVLSLQIPKRSKVLLVGVFMVGGIVILASILRMTTLKHGSEAKDQTKGTFSSTCWTTVEANVAIIGACLPVLRNALVACFPKIFERSLNRSSGSESGNHQHSARGGLNGRTASRKHYTDIEANKTRSNRQSVIGGSDEAIFEDGHNGFPLNGIMKKTDVDLEIHDVGSADGSIKSRERDFH